MKRAVIAACVLFLSLPASMADGQDETVAIAETARNYMESWYQADARRMKASLHTKLAKRSLQKGYGTQKDLRLTSASDMVSYTQQGYGSSLWREGMKIEGIVLDHFK